MSLSKENVRVLGRPILELCERISLQIEKVRKTVYACSYWT